MHPAVEITGLAYGGSGVGRVNGKVVFVPFTAPGDVVKVRVTAGKKGFDEASIVEVITPSPLRVDPPCPVFGRCGGCQLQHIEYAHQARLKEEIFEDTLKRIGRIREALFEGPVPSLKSYNYRGRARLHVRGALWGFFESGTNNVVDIEGCPLLLPALNGAYGEIREALTGPARDRAGGADINSMEIGLSPADGLIVALFNLKRGQSSFDWKGALKGVNGLKGFEVWEGALRERRRVLSHGDVSINYAFEDIRYSVSVSAFTQVNYDQNVMLIKKVLEYAGLTGGEKVVDLFSGAGNLTFPLARGALGTGEAGESGGVGGVGGAAVVGVEAAAEAYRDALKNAGINRAKGVAFVNGDSARWISENMGRLERERPVVIVLDPPRGGDIKAARAIAGLKPEKVIYVSCSPPTLARDLSVLAGMGFKSLRASLIDMFPQTYHIEGVIEAAF